MSGMRFLIFFLVRLDHDRLLGVRGDRPTARTVRSSGWGARAAGFFDDPADDRSDAGREIARRHGEHDDAGSLDESL